MTFPRYRYTSTVLGVFALIVLSLLADPTFGKFFDGVPFGASIILTTKSVAFFGVAAFVTHVGRKTLADYIDLSMYFKKASETSTGAGIAVVGLSLYVLAYTLAYAALVISQ